MTARGELLGHLTIAAERRSGLDGILEAVCDVLGAHACILWSRMSPDLEEPEPRRQQLFVVASWARSHSNWMQRPLSARASAAGYVLRTKNARLVSDADAASGVDRDTDFLSKAGIKSLAAVPVSLLDGRECALCVYSQKRSAFSRSDVKRLRELGTHLAFFHQAVSNQASLRLLQRAAGCLADAETLLGSRRVVDSHEDRRKLGAVRDPAFRRILLEIAELTSERFRCVETSVFLEDIGCNPTSFRLAATTWPADVAKQVYRPSRDDGLTGWVLAERREVRITDLTALKLRPESLEGTYPGLQWHDSLDITSQLRQFQQWPTNAALPVISWMATPILVEGRVVGVIRCCAAKRSPYYFGPSEIELLRLVSGQISRLWSGVSRYAALLRESSNWQALVSSIETLNTAVPEALAQNPIDEQGLFDTALRLTASVIGGSHSTDVRLYDPEKKDLYFAAVSGEPWSSGASNEVLSRRRRRFPIDASSTTSIGAHVFTTQKVYSNLNVRADSLYSETFPDTVGMIVAPISLKEERYGVLDIRFPSPEEFPAHAVSVAQLLGEQLGLYHYLAKTLNTLRDTEAKLSTTLRAQRQTFEDLKHQLNGPINTTYQRADALVANADASEGFRRSARYVRGLAGKARRVAQNLGIYVQLANGQAVPVRPIPLRRQWLIPAVIEAASDNELMIEPERRISIEVDRDSFDVVNWIDLSVDRNLLEQALNNLLDNAGKYSFQGSSIRVYAGLTNNGRFHISVLNRGLALREGDVKAAVQREWRSPIARKVSDAGSGIGLWIVDQMMKAQGGNLIIVPTDAADDTEFKLIWGPTHLRRRNAYTHRRG